MCRSWVVFILAVDTQFAKSIPARPGVIALLFHTKEARNYLQIMIVNHIAQMSDGCGLSCFAYTDVDVGDLIEMRASV